MNFQEAKRRFDEYKRKFDAGHLTRTQFDEQREQLKVRDDQGRWWAKGSGEDDWYYHDGTKWIPGTPPGYEATPPLPDPPTPPRPPFVPWTPPGYLLPASIAATLLCCLPTGIAAIAYSVQANSKSRVGDTAGASQRAKNAQLWLWISVGVGLIVIFLAIVTLSGGGGGVVPQY